MRVLAEVPGGEGEEEPQWRFTVRPVLGAVCALYPEWTLGALGEESPHKPSDVRVWREEAVLYLPEFSGAARQYIWRNKKSHQNSISESSPLECCALSQNALNEHLPCACTATSSQHWIWRILRWGLALKTLSGSSWGIWSNVTGPSALWRVWLWNVFPLKMRSSGQLPFSALAKLKNPETKTIPKARKRGHIAFLPSWQALLLHKELSPWSLQALHTPHPDLSLVLKQSVPVRVGATLEQKTLTAS